jgi:hypothetical protein
MIKNLSQQSYCTANVVTMQCEWSQVSSSFTFLYDLNVSDVMFN